MIAQSEDKFYEEIGERIRSFRLKAGINQELFSELVNMTRASVVNIEKGRQRPSLYLLIRISGILKIEYIDLIPYELNIEKISSIDKKQMEVDFGAIIANSDVDLNDKVKNSMNQFMKQIKK